MSISFAKASQTTILTMKKTFFLTLALPLLLISCNKDSDSTKSGNSHGITSTADITSPSNFDWKTTRTISIDISTLAANNKQVVMVEDLRGNLLLSRNMIVTSGSTLSVTLPKADRSVVVKHNGISNAVMLSAGTNQILTMKKAERPHLMVVIVMAACKILQWCIMDQLQQPFICVKRAKNKRIRWFTASRT